MPNPRAGDGMGVSLPAVLNDKFKAVLHQIPGLFDNHKRRGIPWLQITPLRREMSHSFPQGQRWVRRDSVEIVLDPIVYKSLIIPLR
jgi:hypothetical protein